MLTQLTNLAENHPVSSARAPSSLKDPTTHVTVTKKPVGEAASDNWQQRQEQRRGEQELQLLPRVSHSTNLPSPTSSTSRNHRIAKADTNRRREQTAREQRKSSTISLNIQSSPQSHRHLRYGLGMGQEEDNSDTSRHGAVCVSTI